MAATLLGTAPDGSALNDAFEPGAEMSEVKMRDSGPGRSIATLA